MKIKNYLYVATLAVALTACDGGIAQLVRASDS